MSGLFADITPLRKYRHFRRIWIGQLVSGVGNQLTVVAVAYQVYIITHSTLMVGLVSLAQLAPSLIGALVGGSLVDASDRRRVLVVTQSTLACTSAGLVLNALSAHPAVWPIFVCAMVAAGVQSVDSSARSAVMKSIVPREDLASAAALQSIITQGSTVIGPAVAGVLIATVGLSSVYVIDTASFGAMIFAVALLPSLRPTEGVTPMGLQSIVEGIRFLKSERFLASTFILDLNCMIFGMPKAVFPALAIGFFHGGAGVVGLLYTAPALGGIVASTLSGWVRSVGHQGRAIVFCMIAWGGAIGLTGIIPILGVGVVLLAIAGAADVIGVVFRTTILQATVPGRLQGRLGGLFFASAVSANRLGDGEAGFAAALAGPTFSVWSGGLASLAGIAVVLWRYPELWKLSRDDVISSDTEKGTAPSTS